MAEPLDFSAFGVPADDETGATDRSALDFSSYGEAADAIDAVPIPEPKPEAPHPSGYKRKPLAPEADRRGDFDAPPQPERPQLDDWSTDPRLVDGVWYARRKGSGVIYKADRDAPDFGVPTDDPKILSAFGKTSPTKAAQRVIDFNKKNAPTPPGNTVEKGEPPTPLAVYSQEASKAFGKGAVDIVGTALKGFAGLTTDNPRRVQEVEQGLAAMGQMDDAQFADFVRRIPENMEINPIAAINYQMAARAARKGEKEKAAGYLKTARESTNTLPLEEQQAYKLGQRVHQSVAGDEFKPRPGWEQSITVQLGQAGGSMMAFVPLSIFGGPAASGLFGISAGSGEAVENAEQSLGKSTREDRAGPYNAGLGTAAGEQVLKAGKLGVFPGATDAIPVETLVERLPQMIPGLRQVAKTPGWGRFSKMVGQIVTQATLEGGQEAGQQYLQNLIQKLTLVPEKDLTEDMLQSFLIGGAVGGIAEAPVAGIEAVFGGHEGGPAPDTGAPPPDAQPAPTPNTAAKADRSAVMADTNAPNPDMAPQPMSGPEQAALLAGAGYTLEDVKGMTPDEYRRTIEDLRQQGATAKPGDKLKSEGPKPGAAPMAPRPKPADLRNGASSQAETPLTAEVMPEEPAADYSTDKDFGRYLRDAFDGGITGDEVAKEMKAAGAPDGAIAYAKRRMAKWWAEEEGEAIDVQATEVKPDAPALLDFSSQGEDAGDGTRTKPAKVADESDMQAAREQVAAEPTEAQAAAGNYKKGHVKVHGLDITLETPKGGKRTGKNPDGTEWSVDMQDDYGYVKRTEGADGEQVDVFLGPNHGSSRAFIVNQVDPETGKFDEHKIVLGADHARQAQNIYERAFSDGSGERRMGGMEEMDVSQIKYWLAQPQKEPASAKETEPGPVTAAGPAIGYTSAPDEDFDAMFDRALDDQFKEPAAAVEPGDMYEANLKAYLASKPLPYPDKTENMAASGLWKDGKITTNGRMFLKDRAAATKLGQQKGKKKQSIKPAVEEKSPAPEKLAQPDTSLSPPASRSKKGSKSLTLLQFIAKNGGIREDRGEMAARDLHKKFIPGYGPLVRKTGKSPDDVLRAAVEAGYIVDPSRVEGGETKLTIQDLYDALDAEQGGKKQFATPAEAQAAEDEAAKKQTKLAETELERYSPDERAFIDMHGFDTFEALDHALYQHGMKWSDWKPETLADAAKIMSSEGLDPVDALERAETAQASADEVELANDHEADIPYVDEIHAGTASQGGEGLRSGGEQDEEPRSEDAPRGESEGPAEFGEAREPASQRGQETPLAAIEKTDAGAQTVLPGAEQVSQAEQAQRKVDEKLKPKAEQKPLEHGLFGDERNQTDIFEALARQKSVGESAISAAKNAVMGLDDVASGLTALFADPNKLGSGPSFDEETYRKALPFFRAGAAHFQAAGRDSAEVIKALVKYLAETAKMSRAAIENMRPYIRRFMEDIRAGKETLDALPPGDDLESDSRTAALGDGLGEADVPAAGGRTRSSAGARGKTGLPGGERPGGSGRLSESNAASLGEPRHLEIPRDEPEPTPRADDARQPERSGGDRREGLPTDRRSDEDAVGVAEKAANLAERRRRQAAAEGTKVKLADKANVAETLPMLFPEQQDDVFRTEQRFEKPDGHGMLLTNGTGTGKTFSGLGVAKRFHKQGKRNILVVAPSQGILLDWQRSAGDMQMPAHILQSLDDTGQGFTLTTYANLGQNQTLADRDWDLIIADEAHKLSSDKNGTLTEGAHALRALTGHPDGFATKAQMVFRKDWARVERLSKIASAKGSTEAERTAAATAYKAYVDKVAPLIEKWKAQPRNKVLFMSATPFAYHFSVDYAEGYLFSFGKEKRTDKGYNSGDGRDHFYMQNFGYRMRNNKLTKPEADVNSEIMERQFHEKLKAEGSLWGRALEIDKDYDRRFVLVDSVAGREIDRAIDFLNEAENGRYRPLAEAVHKRFDYLARMRLLEAINARSATGYIKASHALGRKVVVMHGYNEGGGFNPFDMNFADEDKLTRVGADGKQISEKAKDVYAAFIAQNPYVLELKFADYLPPIAQLQKEFPGALVYNGTVSVKERDRAKKRFNDESDTGANLIVVQAAAGEAGISLHDIEGLHQRVLINLGMPIRPTTSIQQEGRIYRVGNETDALFRYFTTGTNWERWTFAGKIAERAGTAENLALGNQARTIRQSFIDAYAEADFYPPEQGEGKGGKERDRALTQESEYEKAKTYYFAQAKNKKRRDHREGIDYFATPEPLGLKMVEWANIRPGEKVLEPSAGHGAIARFFPETTARTLVEPSSGLASKAALYSPNARVIVDRFENLDLVNKYDAIVMNPPFGQGGSTAIQHLEKAARHLRNGGRIVAIIPVGPSADARYQKWMEGAKDIYWVDEVLLPSVTFERAGTTASARVVILEKQTQKADVAKLQPTSGSTLVDAKTINEFFDRLEHTEVDPRVEPAVQDIDEIPADGRMTVAGVEFRISRLSHDPKDTSNDATPLNKIGGRFAEFAKAAEAAGGRWSKVTKSFTFKNIEQLKDFFNRVANPAAAPEPQQSQPVAGVTFKTADTTNVKLNKPTYVASIESRVEREAFDQVAAIAKKHGGYYSTFNRAPAVPGFQFPTKEARAAFIAEVSGPAPQPTPPKGTFEQLERVPDMFRPDISGERRAEVIRTAQAVANQILGRSLRLGVVDELENGSQGRFIPELRAVIIALRASLNPIETLGHEIIHGLREIGAITKPEWAAISRWAREAVLPDFEASGMAQRYRDYYGSEYPNLRPERLEEIILEEAVAEYFGRFLANHPSIDGKTPKAIVGIFTRLREFLTRLRNHLAGAGFRTAEDIFEGIVKGEKRDAPVGESSRDFTLEQMSADIHDLIDFAKTGPGNETKTVEIGEVSAAVADILKQDAGVDVSGFVHTIDAFAIRHILKEHGAAETEVARGQLPVTDADIEAIPAMLARATHVVTGLKGRRGQDIVGYLTRADDGAVAYLEEVRTGRERLAAISMRKYPPATKSDTIVAGLSPHVRDVPGSKLNIRPIPGRRKGAFESLRPGGRMPKPGPNAPAATFTEPQDDALTHLTNRNIGMLARIRGASAAALLPARRAMQDDMADQLRVEKAITEQHGPINPAMMAYRAHTLYAGRAGTRLEELRDDDFEPLLDEMVKRGVTHEEIDDFLYARHAPERNAHVAGINPLFPDGGSGMLNAEAQQIMSAFISAGKMQDMMAIGAMVDSIQQDTRDRLLAGGLIDQPTWDNWTHKYQYYAPLQGFEQDPDEDARVAVGQRYDTRVKLTHAALGRSSRADSPFAHIIAKAQQSVILAEKARANTTLFRLARSFPNPRLWTVNQVVMKRYIDKKTGLVTSRPDRSINMRASNVIAVRVGGRIYTITLHHDGLAKAWKGMEAAAMPSFMRALASLGRYFAITRTGLNPEFFVPNFIRDATTAGVHISADQGARILRQTMKHIPKAMRGVWQESRGRTNSQWAQYAEEFKRAGGAVGIFGLKDIESIKNRIAWDLWKASPGMVQKTVRGGSALYDFVMDVNGAVENAVRLSLYVAMRQNGASQDAAALAAKEVTVNFNRKGQWGAWLNAGYLFFNASVQGTARVAKALATSKVARRFAYGMIVAGFIQDIVNSMMSGDDDDDGEKDYDQLPEWQRERNMIFMLPGSSKAITVPMPWVYNVFHYAGTNLSRVVRGKVSPTEAMANIGSALLQAANPIQSATLLQMISPTLVDPVGDIQANTDWKGDPIYPDRGDLDKRPDSQKYYRSVSPLWQGMTDFLNSATGGDEVRPGAIDVSPESVEYIADFIAGGIGTFYNNIATTVGHVVRGEALDIDRLPIVRRVVIDTKGTRTARDEYYRILDAVELTKRQMKAFPDRAAEIAKEYPADVQIQPMLKGVKKALEQLKAKQASKKTSTEKEVVTGEMDAIMAKVRKRYRELLKSTGQRG